MQNVIKVIIVDDHASVRKNLKLLIDAQPDMKVVGTADQGVTAFHEALKSRPDIVLMDIKMPVLDGIIGTGLFVSSFSSPQVVIMSNSENPEHQEQVLNAGAYAFLNKGISSRDLLSTLRTAYHERDLY